VNITVTVSFIYCGHAAPAGASSTMWKSVSAFGICGVSPGGVVAGSES